MTVYIAVGADFFSLVSFVCVVSVLIYRIFHEKFARTAFAFELLHVAEIPF